MVEGHGPKKLRKPDVVILDAPASGHGIAWMAAPRLVAEVISSGPIGNLAAEITTFLEDRDRFGVVVVTTAEEMPVQESIELLEAMEKRLDRRPELVVVNALYPPAPKPRRSDDEATRLWTRRRAVNEEQLARLTSRWDGPLAEVALEPIDAGPILVGLVGEQLAQGLRGT
jgi:anion-transporting  ArsA/GET3 family ATPase